MIFALASTPKHWQNAYILAQANKLAAHGQWEKAYQSYGTVVEEFFDDTEIQLNYGEAAIASGHQAEATMILKRVNGRKLSFDEVTKANYITYALDSAVHQQTSAKPTKANGRPRTVKQNPP